MNFIKYSFIIILNIYFIGNIESATWVISCKPCTEILKSCEKCLTEQECIDCANNLGNTKCSTCYQDIFKEQNTLNCDNSVNYQFLACKTSCQVKRQLNGACDKNGQCTCGTKSQIELILNSDINFIE